MIAVAIGFESPIAEELKAMDKRLKPEEMISLSRLYSRAGFFIHGMFIFGYPVPKGVDFRMGARERVRHFRKFIKKAKIDTIQVLLPVPVPGHRINREAESRKSHLSERLHRMGILRRKLPALRSGRTDDPRRHARFPHEDHGEILPCPAYASRRAAHSCLSGAAVLPLRPGKGMGKMGPALEERGDEIRRLADLSEMDLQFCPG